MLNISKKIILILIVNILLISCKGILNPNKDCVQNLEAPLPLSSCPLSKKGLKIDESKKTKRILSIDGGGVRGIIPARILQEFEIRSGKPINELFDFMVGNSTGGIIVLALNTPNKFGQAKYKASDLVELYKVRSNEIFKKSFFRKIYTGFGLWAPKYDRKNYDKILTDYFGYLRMSQLIKPTGVLSYGLNTGLPYLWTREYSRQKSHKDFLVKDIAAVTTAAPTYFAPKLLMDTNNNAEYQADGGIYANNPQLAAIFMSQQLDDRILPENIILISIGTGTIKLSERETKLKDAGIIGWVIKGGLIDVMMNSESDIEDSIVAEIYKNSCRMQIGLDINVSAMDDSSKKHMDTLLQLTEKYINDNSQLIDEILKALSVKLDNKERLE